MKRLIVAVCLLLITVPAFAGTLTITGSGFANLGASPPAGWPSNVTFPALGNPNGTKTYTVSDADWQSLLTWMAAAQAAQISGVTGQVVFSNTAPLTPTAAQILLAWLQIWVNGTKASVQQFQTAPAAPPAPITIQ